jgi:hypothetical protein
MRDIEDMWVFRHFQKIFTGMVILIIGVVFIQFALAVWIGVEIEENGLKSVVERIWEGDKSD